MFEPKFVKQRPALPLDTRQTLAATLQSKLSTKVSWHSGRGDFLVNGHVFCSITREGALALKLPAKRVEELIGEGRAKPWQVGRRTLGDWVVISATDDPEWALQLMREAKTCVGADPAK